MINTVAMKKLLTLVVLVAGVALFAGCMDKPATIEDEATTGAIVEETTTDEVTPAEDTTGTVEETPTPEVTAE